MSDIPFIGYDDIQVRYKALGQKVITDWISSGDSIYDDDGSVDEMFKVWCYAADWNWEKLVAKLEKLRK